MNRPVLSAEANKSANSSGSANDNMIFHVCTSLEAYRGFCLDILSVICQWIFFKCANNNIQIHNKIICIAMARRGTYCCTVTVTIVIVTVLTLKLCFSLHFWPVWIRGAYMSYTCQKDQWLYVFFFLKTPKNLEKNGLVFSFCLCFPSYLLYIHWHCQSDSLSY